MVEKYNQFFFVHSPAAKMFLGEPAHAIDAESGNCERFKKEGPVHVLASSRSR